MKKNKESVDPIHKIAMDLLARREHSRQELFFKLKKRGFDDQEILEELNKLKTNNWQDDERFTEMYIQARTRRGYGPCRIRMELEEKGVATDIIQSYLDDEWIELAKQVRCKRFGGELPKQYNEKAKQMRFLQYRGFTVEQINKALKND